MRVLIVSDIHGFNSYMEKLLDIIVNTKPDKIVLLGDIKYNYLQTDILNKLCLFKDKIIAVKGNCDDKNDIRAVNFPVYEFYYVLKADGFNWYLSHGHVNYKLPELGKNDILINGHTHSYELRYNYINPGSLSLPRNHDERTYILYQNCTFTLYDLDNNIIDFLKI